MRPEKVSFFCDISENETSFQDFEKAMRFFDAGPWGKIASLSLLDLEREQILDFSELKTSEIRYEYFLRLQGELTPFHFNLTRLGDAIVLGLKEFGFLIGFLAEEVTFSTNNFHDVLYDCVKEFAPLVSSVSLRRSTSKIMDKHFPHKTIVPHSGILSWLHYFSPAAIAEHKLQRLFENPHLTVTPVGEGHLFQVLEDPFAINTPEGEAKVIAANQWMLDH